MNDFFKFERCNDLIDLFQIAYKEGLEGAVFQPFTIDSLIAESLLLDLYKSKSFENAKILTAVYGYNYKSLRPFNKTMYEMIREVISKNPKDEIRHICNGIIENIIFSDQIRIVLLVDNKIPISRIGNHWIEILYGILNDTIENDYWNTADYAISILAFNDYNSEKFKDVLNKYESFLVKKGGDLQIINELRKGQDSSMFNSIMTNVIYPKVDAAMGYTEILDEEQMKLVENAVIHIKG